MCVDLEFHHLPSAQWLILPFSIYSLMKGQESLALLFHSFHLYFNQIPCSLQFLQVIPLRILQLHCTMLLLMRYVPNQRVPSSGYCTLNSIMQSQCSGRGFTRTNQHMPSPQSQPKLAQHGWSIPKTKTYLCQTCVAVFSIVLYWLVCQPRF